MWRTLWLNRFSVSVSVFKIRFSPFFSHGFCEVDRVKNRIVYKKSIFKSQRTKRYIVLIFAIDTCHRPFCNSRQKYVFNMPESRSRSTTRKSSHSSGRPKTPSESHSRSSSKSRRPFSLTRRRSSQRLVRTISVYSDASTGEDTVVVDSPWDSLRPGSAAEDESILSSADGHRSDAGENLGIHAASQGLNEPNEVIEVPFVKTFLDSSLPQDYFKTDVLNTIQSLKIHKWHVKGHKDVSPLNKDILKLTKITGAMTNVIYKVEYKRLPSLLLRVFGKNNGEIIDRDYELEVLARLSVRNIGPSLYGCFQNGRFEQFLENAQTLGKDDIRDWKTSQRIARRMKELHTGVPLLAFERKNGPVSWAKIAKWIETLELNHPEWVDNNDNIKRVLLCHDWKSFKQLILRYRDFLSKEGEEDINQSMVFCHNDAQYGNLLFTSPVIKADKPIPLAHKSSSSTSLFPSESKVSLDQIIHPTIQDQSQDKKLVVIDFEYAGANPAAYDLANHLSEWMHDYNNAEPYKCNKEAFPNKEHMLNFIYSYVSHLKGNSTDSIDAEVRKYYNEILKWRPTVQLFWSVWAILQSGQLQTECLENQETEGTGGGKYLIKSETDPTENCDSVNIESIIQGIEGVDVDSFEYLLYCRDKMSLFWGDLIKQGIVNEDECIASEVEFIANQGL